MTHVKVHNKRTMAAAAIGRADATVADATMADATPGDADIEQVFTRDNATALERLLTANPSMIGRRFEMGARTLVHLAARYASIECLKLLIARGANLCEMTANGANVLHIAAASKYRSVSICKLLMAQEKIKHTRLINQTDVNGETPLLLALQNSSPQCALVFLDDPFVDVNVASKFGITALHMAAGNGYDAVVDKLLLRTDINVNALCYWKQSAIMYAVQHYKWNCFIKLLWDNRVNVNMLPRPLVFLAIKDDRFEMVKELIKSGKIKWETSAPVGKDGKEMTAFEYADELGKGAWLKGVGRA